MGEENILWYTYNINGGSADYKQNHCPNPTAAIKMEEDISCYTEFNSKNHGFYLSEKQPFLLCIRETGHGRLRE
jgi:hypothetical protein